MGNFFEDEGFKRENKYFVLKVEDLKNYLTNEERFQLDLLVIAITKGREGDGKSKWNRYVVVNEDEPYAEKVWELIQAYWEE